MAMSAIQLSARALLAIGCEPITGFDDGTADADVSAMLYPGVRAAVLSAYPWSFATAQRALPEVAAQPVADFAHAFALPEDFLRALSVGHAGTQRGRGVSYRIHERRIHTDAAAIVLTYVFRPDERTFPPFFDQALIARLAAEFCLPLTENTARSELAAKRAEIEFKLAKSVDAQQQTPNRFEDFSLLEVRR